VRAEWETLKDGPLLVDENDPTSTIARIKAHFAPPAYRVTRADVFAGLSGDDERKDFGRWFRYNTVEHKAVAYRAVFVSLKGKLVNDGLLGKAGSIRAPGDITADEMEAVAAVADRYSFGLIRATHTQNLLLGDVHEGDLVAVWRSLKALGLAHANIGTLQDVICCPGLDYCNLANATSIPIAKAVTDRFDDLDHLYDLGEIKLKMSGCINSCGHHHVGHIGILGVDMKGHEAYQILLGGSEEVDASIGKWIGPAVDREQVPDAIEKILTVYVERRERDDERFLDVVKRIGLKPFAERVYA